MSCSFTYKSKDYSEKELLAEIKREMIENIRQERNNSPDYTREDMANFVQKIVELKKFLDVEVIMDETTESSMVLKKSDPRTKLAGKPVILINPNAIFKTTAIHEFGHIFIDSFPNGMENPRLKKAYEQIEGTALEQEIRDKYPGLTENQLRKEMIVTAIGRKGAEIWDSQQDISKFQHFINWFRDFISRTFGVGKDEVVALTQELLSGKVKNKNLLAGLEDINQKELTPRTVGVKEDALTNEAVNEKSLEKVYDETLARVKNILKEYTPRGKKAIEKEAALVARLAADGKKSRYESIKELADEMEKLDGANKRKGLFLYTKWVRTQANILRDAIPNRTADNQNEQDQLNFIKKALEWNQGFDMVKDIQDIVTSYHSSGTITDKEKEFYNKILKEVQGVRSEITTGVMEAARKQYARIISRNDNKVAREYETGFAVEYVAKNIEASTGKTKEEYIIEKMNEHKEEIETQAYYVALERANESIMDISAFSANFMSEKNANSQDILIISKMIDQVELEIANEVQVLANRFDSLNNEYNEEVSSDFNQEKKYEKMIDKSGEHATFASEFLASFYEEEKKVNKAAGDRESAEEMYGDIKVDGNSYTNKDGKTRELLPNELGYSKVEVKGTDVFFFNNGERSSMTIAEAIAITEYGWWVYENTETVNKKTYPKKSIWENKQYTALTAKEKKHLKSLKDTVIADDKKFEGASQLSRTKYNSTIVRLPGMMKSQRQILFADKNVKGFASRLASELTAIQKDDFETAESEGNSARKSMKVLANVSNNEVQKIPVPYRNKLSKEEQSYDLHTIVLMNSVAAINYEKKKAIENSLTVILEVMKDKDVIATNPMGRKKVHASSEEDNEVELTMDRTKGISNEARKAADLIENRLYGIKSKDAGEINLPNGKKVNVQQATKSWLTLSGMNALLGNITNSFINLGTGTFSNLIEAIGGEHYNLRDWARAKRIYSNDLKGILSDIGSNVHKSRTSRLMKTFNVIGSKTILNSNFEDSTRAHALANMDTLRPFANAGEHMMQAQTMYAVLEGIKVMNKDGKYIDANGNVVGSKKEAASLNDMIIFDKNGKMSLDPNVESTTFTLTGGASQILLEARNLIKDKIFELHGNYDSDIQAAAQRQAWGKIVFFLRKWLEGGILRRWRGGSKAFVKKNDLTEADKFYSQDSKDYKEGYYVTSLRFMRTFISAIAKFKMEVIINGYKGLSTHEKSNIRKTIADLAAIALIFLSFFGMDEDDEETIALRYGLRRQAAELAFFINPVESLKVVSTPSASVGMLSKLIKILDQLMDPFEEYKQGKNKGRNKLTVKMLKALPVFSQTEKDLEASLNFIEKGGI